MDALKEMGIDKEQIDKYCQTVASFVPEKNYFSIESLKHSGLSFRFENCPFGDWFYASLLAEKKEDFSFLRVGQTKLFCRGTERFASRDFLRNILEEKRELSLDELEGLLLNFYGINMRRDKLRSVIQDANLQYDVVTNLVSC